MTQTPSVGRIVLYKLSEQDAEQINKRRSDFAETLRESRKAGKPLDSGYVAHIGNPAEAGQVFPAMVVRRWGDAPTASIQLQVSLDGNDTFWATSVNEGDGERQWSWPPRV